MADNKEKDIDQITGVSTTGHDWDGIKELNNPLPRWWLWVFYATILFSAIYVVLYPAIPLVNSATGGILGWNSRSAVVGDVARLDATRGDNLAAMREADLHQIVADETLLSFAQAYGRAAFGDNCAACHGAGAGGAATYPNLLDDDWLWGGTLEDVHQTIAFGIRSSHHDTRLGSMPAFVRDGLLSRAEAFAIADYVRSINGLPIPDTADVAYGSELFRDNCAACHGDDATGMREIGAPNLTNDIWLYGSDRAAIVDGITHGRGGVMPHFGERLDEVTVKALTVYVHSLGGGE
jgi:cytochrome c oxidase cbb3-type subunit III